MVATVAVLSSTVPPPLAPAIAVRWAADVTPAQRQAAEAELSLLDGRFEDGTTWAYDFGNPSSAGTRALLRHAAVEDTRGIDRVRAVVAADAPAGTTRLRTDWLSAAVNSPLHDWTGLFALLTLLVAMAWLATTPVRQRQPPAR